MVAILCSDAGHLGLFFVEVSNHTYASLQTYIEYFEVLDTRPSPRNTKLIRHKPHPREFHDLSAAVATLPDYWKTVVRSSNQW